MLVNDILLLSKMENKTTKLNIEDIDIKDFISTILERFAIYKNDGYIFEFNEKETYIIEADKQGLERVIYNLVNNAINYTGNNKKVFINVKENKNNVIIEITDTGKGIPENEIKNIWNKYYHKDKKYKRNETCSFLYFAFKPKTATFI